MPLPGALTTCTLSGAYLAPDGTPLGGQLTFVPSGLITDGAGQVVLAAIPLTVRLQPATGTFSITLACTDNADLAPAGWQWHVSVLVAGAQESFYFGLPSTLGPAADISALTPVGTPPSGSSFVSSINGQTGAVDLADGFGILPPAGDLAGTTLAPTVAKIQGTAISTPPGGTTEFLRGDGSWHAPAGSGGISPPAGDLGGTAGSPTVVATHLAAALPVAQGGTGQATQQAAINALTGTQSAGTFLRSNGTNAALTAIGAADIPAVAAGASIIVAASNAPSRIQDYADYVCTGTNDHVTINSAISALPGEGGRVLLSPGTFSVAGAVTITSSNITLEGAGVATCLSVPEGTNISYVISVTGTGTVEVKIRKLFIQGSFGDTFGDGIYINTPWQSTDTQHVLEDIYITNCPNNGVHIPADADTRVVFLNRVHVKNCKGNGFLFQFPSQTDSVFTDCIADTIGLNGFFLGGANNWLTNCKTFYCGNLSTTAYGFYIVGYNHFFEGCQAQDNYNHGFYGDNSGDQTYGSFGCTFVNCSADSNGQNGSGSGLTGVGVQQWQVIGGVWFNRPYPPAWHQLYGVNWQDSGAAATGTRPSTNNSVTGALFHGNFTAPIADTSTGPNYTSSNTYSSGTAPSALQGKMTVPSLQVKTGAINGYVLTSDSIGNATWQSSSGGGGGATSPVDWLSAVNSYSADPTGAADSTTAINNALAAASSGTVVYLAAGTYQVTAPIVIPQGVTLLGAAGGFAIPIGNYGIGGLPITGTVLKPSSSFSGTAVISLTSSASQSGQQQMRSFSIDCSSLTGTPTVHGIEATNGVAGVKMRDVLVYGGNGKTAGHGLYLLPGANTNPDFWDVSHCKFSGFAGNGVTLTGVADCYFTACEASGNTGWGWSITNGNNTRFVICKAEGASTTGGGWLLTANSGFTGQLSFNGCTSSSNHLDGWQLNGPGAGIWTFTGCRSNNDAITSGASFTIQGSFAGTAQLTGIATVPATTTPANGLKISSASSSARIQVANATIWGVSAAVSNDASAGSLLFDGNCIFTTGALASPTPVPQPLAIAQGGTAATSASAALSGLGGAAVAGDLGGTSASPTVAKIQGTAVSAPSGGATAYLNATGGWTTPAGGGFSSPMTTVGDIIYEGTGPAAARLAGTTSATKQFLTQTGTGSVSAAPAWGTLASGDIPGNAANTSGTAAGLSSTLAIASGGTGQTGAAAAYNALSPMTTLGDLEYESGASTAARLAGNTAAQVKYLSQTGTGSASAAPAWGVVSGQFLCTPTSYAPGTQTSLSVSTTTMAAFSSANVNTGSFTAPPSGTVMVTVSFVAQASADAGFAVNLAAHGTVTPMLSNAVIPKFPTGTTVTQPVMMSFMVTGLTPGTSYNLDLVGCATSADSATILAIGTTSTTPTVSSGGQGAPVVMSVQAV